MKALSPAIPLRNIIFSSRAILETSFNTLLAAVSSLDLPVAHSLKLKSLILLPSAVFVGDPPSVSMIQVVIFSENLRNSDYTFIDGYRYIL